MAYQEEQAQAQTLRVGPSDPALTPDLNASMQPLQDQTATRDAAEEAALTKGTAIEKSMNSEHTEVEQAQDQQQQALRQDEINLSNDLAADTPVVSAAPQPKPSLIQKLEKLEDLIQKGELLAAVSGGGSGAASGSNAAALSGLLGEGEQLLEKLGSGLERALGFDADSDSGASAIPVPRPLIDPNKVG